MALTEFPAWRGKLEYVCQKCGARFPGDELHYSCPRCGGVFLLEDTRLDELKDRPGSYWRDLFDKRQMTRLPALRGIFRFYELIAPVFEQQDIVYLGEANTPIIAATERLQKQLATTFAFKNDGQNPSASFKDRGMACAFSCLKWLCRIHGWDEVLTICASTGDTSAAAALYAAYVGPPLKSVVLLPKGRVTSQQLSQPLGSGATVLELPGVFDDCMRVVEILAERYRVALLNSKNSWRILGQESYPFEIAQWRDWQMEDLCIFVPIGNAGNITAIMAGFLKLLRLEIITRLPRIFGVQSEHADPVFRYYDAPKDKRVWQPVEVRPSVAQAAMIGNPVSIPRVQALAQKYIELAGQSAFQVVRVTEQEIMDAMLLANRHGHIACTQGGECLAGMSVARDQKLMTENEYAILDSTAHALKFADFQTKYFLNQFGPEYEITPDPELSNSPEQILPEEARQEMTNAAYAQKAAEAVANRLSLIPEKAQQ